MDSERLNERISDYHKALLQLEKAVLHPKDEFIRDSVIQRFEFTHELAWKMLRLRLESEGILVKTPRETMQEALQAGFIVDGNLWSDMQKMRIQDRDLTVTPIVSNSRKMCTIYRRPRLAALSGTGREEQDIGHANG